MYYYELQEEDEDPLQEYGFFITKRHRRHIYISEECLPVALEAMKPLFGEDTCLLGEIEENDEYYLKFTYNKTTDSFDKKLSKRQTKAEIEKIKEGCFKRSIELYYNQYKKLGGVLKSKKVFKNSKFVYKNSSSISCRQ